MTKEELEKEAEEWIAKNSKEFITNPNYSPFDYAEAIYLAGAEPREKQIQIDAEQIRALQKQNGELTDKVKELEKENLELRKQLVEKGQHLDLTEKEWGKDLVQMYNFKTLYTKQSEQLTKAKEIINTFVDWKKGEGGYDLPKDFLYYAEQFLNEVEK